MESFSWQMNAWKDERMEGHMDIFIPPLWDIGFTACST